MQYGRSRPKPRRPSSQTKRLLKSIPYFIFQLMGKKPLFRHSRIRHEIKLILIFIFASISSLGFASQLHTFKAPHQFYLRRQFTLYRGIAQYRQCNLTMSGHLKIRKKSHAMMSISVEYIKLLYLIIMHYYKNRHFFDMIWELFGHEDARELLLACRCNGENFGASTRKVPRHGSSAR